ncbi:MAG: TolC family protein [Magnetococcales bacterium]|nr:TolC family protein [Magnetococcales bacterium]
MGQFLRLLLVVAGIALAGSAQARDWVDVVTTPWEDPLLTRPPVLDSGKVLPGDTDPPPCAGDIASDGAELLQPLALTRAVDLALCHNPQARSAWAAIKVQAAAVGEARAAYLPTLSASGSRLNDQTRYPGSNLPATDLNSDTLSGNLSWRLLDFGGRDANRESANALLGAALANHDAVVQKILTEVVGAYFDAQTAQATWFARQTSASLSRQTLETARRREARGSGAQSDTLQAATALARATLERNRAQGAYHKALLALVYALGLPTGTPVTLAEDLLDSANRMQQDLHAWLEQARIQHPALLAARAQLESAKEKVIATRAEGLPTLDATGSFFQNGRPNQGVTTIKTQETQAGVTLNIPIFDGFARTYKVQGAQAQVEQKEAELQDTEHQVLMEVLKAHADARAALANLTASQDLLAAAQEAIDTVQHKFARGAADILEILNTQTALSDAQQERIRCLADWRSARLRLLSTAGLLGRGEVDQTMPREGHSGLHLLKADRVQKIKQGEDQSDRSSTNLDASRRQDDPGAKLVLVWTGVLSSWVRDEGPSPAVIR